MTGNIETAASYIAWSVFFSAVILALTIGGLNK